MLVFAFTSLWSIQLLSGDKDFTFDRKLFNQNDYTELTTEKEKDGKSVPRNWNGIKLQTIFDKYDIPLQGVITFTSSDNYLVRLTAEEIAEFDPLIAFFCNSEPLSDNSRLVIPGKAAMFWIRDISTIKQELNKELQFPETVFIAEYILKYLDLITDPKPFKNVKGYYLTDFLQQVFPQLSGEYLLIGKDGTQHSLDYDEFLKQGVLVVENNCCSLQSPQMPGGMWLKNLAYIQKGNTAVVFHSLLDNWQELQNLLKWINLPAQMQLYLVDSQKIITEFPPFSDAIWNNVQKIKW